MNGPKVDLKNPKIAAFLAWLVPGLGHLYQGRRGKAILYFVCIVGLFVTGMWMGEWKIVFWRWVNPLQNSEDFRLWYPAQFWAGLLAFPALLQATLAKWGMNPIIGGFEAEPTMDVINKLHSSAGRFVDIGVVYTSIAGLLNVLAIYDAYEGPAIVEETPQAQPTPAATPVAAAVPPPAPVMDEAPARVATPAPSAVPAARSPSPVIAEAAVPNDVGATAVPLADQPVVTTPHVPATNAATPVPTGPRAEHPVAPCLAAESPQVAQMVVPAVVVTEVPAPISPADQPPVVEETPPPPTPLAEPTSATVEEAHVLATPTPENPVGSDPVTETTQTQSSAIAETSSSVVGNAPLPVELTATPMTPAEAGA